MTKSEFSNGFDTLVDSYRRFRDFDKHDMRDTVEFDEYEKSFYLTLAQDELVVNFYNGRNSYGDSFENTEEMRRYLDELVETHKPKVASTSSGISAEISGTSKFYTLPDDLAFIIYEQVTLDDTSLGCYDGTVINVYPVPHDDYNKIKKNPFRGPTKYKALRLDAGKGIVEIISDYTFKDYLIRYVRRPGPILLEDFTGTGVSFGNGTVVTDYSCELDPMFHDAILKRAVQLALASKGINTNS